MSYELLIGGCISCLSFRSVSPPIHYSLPRNLMSFSTGLALSGVGLYGFKYLSKQRRSAAATQTVKEEEEKGAKKAENTLLGSNWYSNLELLRYISRHYTLGQHRFNMELDINPSSQQVSPISFTTPPRVFHDDLEEQPEVAARGDKCPGPRTSFVEKRMVRTNASLQRNATPLSASRLYLKHPLPAQPLRKLLSSWTTPHTLNAITYLTPLHPLASMIERVQPSYRFHPPLLKGRFTGHIDGTRFRTWCWVSRSEEPKSYYCHKFKRPMLLPDLNSWVMFVPS